MDPLDIMLNKERVIPHYQPVVSADTQMIIGYEVRAYYQDEQDNMQNLDWFFKDSTIPEEFLLEINSYIQQQAIEYFLKANNSLALFFNYDSKLLSKDKGKTLLDLLLAYAESGLDLNKIVIQVKDDFPEEEFDSMRQLFNYMKTMGIQISLVEIGKRSGNLDQLALLEPNIIKLDVRFLKDSGLPHLYRDVHHSLTMLARKIGATLMFRGISNYNQLNYAWRNGGRYYQGRYLMRSQTEFVSADSCKEIIQRNFQLFVNHEREKMKAQLELTGKIAQQFNTILESIKPEESHDELILKIGEACSNLAFRVYVCNEEGLQLSSNAEKNAEGKWELYQEGLHKNWSWRPYFFENIARMSVEKKGILSDLYTDIERSEQIRTYSYPLSKELYIFLDIPYMYLFEQEGLL